MAKSLSSKRPGEGVGPQAVRHIAEKNGGYFPADNNAILVIMHAFSGAWIGTDRAGPRLHNEPQG